MKKKKITVLINDNHKELRLRENINDVTLESTLTVESATVFWDYNNVTKGVNDTFTHNGNTITVPEGYWTPNMIAGIRNKRIVHVKTSNAEYYDYIAQLFLDKSGSGGFSAYSGHASYAINLGSFGTLLGFDANTPLPAKKKILSQNPSDYSNGLMYITVSCDIVDDARNIGVDGGRSNVILTLPRPSYDVDLKRAVTQHYIDPESSGGIPLHNGCYNRLVFDVNTNIGPTTIGSILLELCINYK